MAGADFGTGKSLVVIALVVGCFAVLWPKIFYPMMQAAFQMTSSSDTEERPFRPRDRPPINQGGVSPHVMAFQEAYSDGVHVKEGRPFPHPSARQPAKPQTKSGGAMSIIMPIYTIGIVVFFLYTILKLVFKKPAEAENNKKPLIKDFHMDPDYHKFVCQPTESERTNSNMKSKVPKPEQEKPKIPIVTKKNDEFDEKDYEIYQLRKKLEETESAMERIMKHMGAVSECLSNTCVLKDAPEAEKKPDTFVQKCDSDTLNSQMLLDLCKSITRVTQAKGTMRTGISSNGKKAKDTRSNNDTGNGNVDSSAETQQMKRDSSINSEGSSFEVLSQSISSGDVTHTSSESSNGSSDEDIEEAHLEEDTSKANKSDSDEGRCQKERRSSDIEEVNEDEEEDEKDDNDEDEESSCYDSENSK